MSIKVLWVDDEPQSLRYEWILAQQQGWHITSADTVSKAMGLIKDTAFDLVVVDLILPWDDFRKQRGNVDPNAGIRLIESIAEPTRTGRTPPDVPLCVITAADVSIGRKAQENEKLSSIRYCLNKPLEEKVYRDVLQEITQALDPSTRNLL
jgi:CheY-like chemotaxis protein